MSERRLAPAEDLNLVPIMNLVTILIPFLLLAAQFVSISVIDSSLPASITDAPTPPNVDELSLRLFVTPGGYVLEGGAALATAGLGESGRSSVPCRVERCSTADQWDQGALSDLLVEVKHAFPEHTSLLLIPDDRVPFEALVTAMDTARERDGELLFPQVSFAKASVPPSVP